MRQQTVSDDQRRRLRLLVRRCRIPVSTERAFEALYGASSHAFWLDSTDRGRFSFLGDASGPLARIARADVWTGEVRVEHGGVTVAIRSGLFNWLERDLVNHAVDTPDLPFGFTLGWVGYLGYELKAE